MVEQIYQMYKEHQRMIDNPEGAESDFEKDLLEDIKLAITLLDEKKPEYRKRYERECKIQASFTPEQIDFICYQIGDWYVEWKHRILIDLEKGTHRLGFAKEQLKSMICGD